VCSVFIRVQQATCIQAHCSSPADLKLVRFIEDSLRLSSLVSLTGVVRPLRVHHLHRAAAPVLRRHLLQSAGDQGSDV